MRWHLLWESYAIKKIQRHITTGKSIKLAERHLIGLPLGLMSDNLILRAGSLNYLLKQFSRDLTNGSF